MSKISRVLLLTVLCLTSSCARLTPRSPAIYPTLPPAPDSLTSPLRKLEPMTPRSPSPKTSQPAAKP